MSGGGGGKQQDNSDQVEAQYDYDMDAWAYNNANAQRKYNHDVLTNAINRRNQEEQALYREGSAANQWDYQMQMRETQHNARVAAYNKSEKMYSAQLGLNQRAAGLAFENARNVNTERQSKLGFEIQQTALKTRLAEKGKTLEHQGLRSKAAFTSQDNFVKSMQAKGAATATGQAGVSANKKYQSIVAESGRAQAAMVEGLTRADSAYNLEMYGLSADYQMKRTQQGQSRLSIIRAFDHSIKKAKFDWFAANVKADANRMSMPIPPPAIPKPLSIPRSILLDPPMPVNSPEPNEGAVVSTQTSGTGGASGALGGAMSGFMMGASTGMPHMAGIGAIVGGIGGLFG